jgi:hypothetical protein
MSTFASASAASAIVLLVAAPGEPPVAQGDVPEAAKAAVIRRLDIDAAPSFRRIVVKPSTHMPGYVVCGEVSARQAAEGGAFERFFAVVPGSFALLDRDGNALVDKYWKLNGCY